MKKLFILLFAGLLSGSVAMAENLIANGDFSGTDFSSFHKGIDNVLSDITSADITTLSGNPYLMITSKEGAENQWDTSLFITLPLPDGMDEGTAYRFTMRAKADRAVTINTWLQPAPGQYNTWHGIGSMNLTTSWQTFVCTGVIDSKQTGSRCISFLLNYEQATYCFDDFTFEILTPEQMSQSDPEELVTNGSFSGSDISSFYKRLGVDNSNEALTSSDIITQSGNSFVKIVSIDNNDNSETTWASMFFIRLNEEVQVGDTYTFSMRAKASRTVSISSQFHGSELGDYIHYRAVGNPTLTTEWDTYTYTGTLTEEQVSGSAFGYPRGIAFQLNIDPNPAEYYFDDISFKVTRSVPTELPPTEINGLEYSFNSETNEATVTWCSLTGDVTVPSTIVKITKEDGPSPQYNDTTYTVTAIGNQAFSSSNVTSVTLPDNVKSIGERAFAYCFNLESISLPSGLETIGEEAFYMDKIHHLSLPTGLKTVGASAFAWNFELYDLYIPSSIESIDANAFYLCPALQTIIYRGQTPIEIPENAFYLYENINLFLPDGGLSAFLVAPYWQLMNISDEGVGYHNANGLCYLHFYADDHMEVLRSNYSGAITIPRAVIISGKLNQSTHCPVTAIRENAFLDCAGITSVTFTGTTTSPSNLTSIGKSAFYGCTGITSVTLPSSLTNLGEMAFVNTGISSVTIPAGVMSIGAHPFGRCQNLTNIKVNSNNSVYDSRNNCKAIIETVTNTLIQGCPTTVIPDDVTSIAFAAFDGFDNLTTVTIPESVTAIGEYAFSNCDNLETVYCYALTPPEIYDATTFPNRMNATLYVPYGKKSVYQDAPYWRDFNSIESIAPDVTLTIGSAGVGTFASPYDLNFAGITGMKAYIASGFKPSTGKLVLTQVDEVPAGTGLYIKGTAGTYTIPVQETDMLFMNFLIGVTEDTQVSPTTDTNTNFILANGAHGIGFYTLSKTGNIAAGKAYLSIPSSALPASANFVGLEFEDEETTGISEEVIGNSEKSVEVWYTIDGQKLDGKPTQKGVYIVNGKKQVIK